jgi:hypothetical protein
VRASGRVYDRGAVRRAIGGGGGGSGRVTGRRRIGGVQEGPGVKGRKSLVTRITRTVRGGGQGIGTEGWVL